MWPYQFPAEDNAPRLSFSTPSVNSVAVRIPHGSLRWNSQYGTENDHPGPPVVPHHLVGEVCPGQMTGNPRMATDDHTSRDDRTEGKQHGELWNEGEVSRSNQDSQRFESQQVHSR